MRGAGGLLALLALAGGCGSERQREPPLAETRERPEQGAEETSDEASSDETPEAEARLAAPTCEERRAEMDASIAAVVAAHAECTYDVECVAAPGGGDCATGCDVAVHPRGVGAVHEAVRRISDALCPPFLEAGCEAPPAECARSTARCASGRCAMEEGEAPLRELAVPAENEARRSEDPPPRPSPGDAEEERARRLFDAVVHDEPERASDFFFPREAFAVVKAIADPDGYWKRLHGRYVRDIHALHAELGDLSDAEFQRLEIIRRGGWVQVGEEGNALPYWVARHNRLYYRVGGEERSFEVRVVITWGDRWYITHLSEFH